MLNELTLLKYFLNREKYLAYGNYFSSLSLEPEIEKIFSSIEMYFTSNPEAEEINLEELIISFNLNNPSLNKNSIYKELFTKIEKLNIKTSLINIILLRTLEKYYAAELIEVTAEVLDDEEFNILNTAVPDILERFNSLSDKINREHADGDFINPDLDALIENEILGDGLNWRLNCLNSTIGPLKGGSLGHVFARVDTGKTSFLVSEVTNFARQLEADEIIVWFGNEEQGSRIQLRIYSSMLATPRDELVHNVEATKESFRRSRGFDIKIYDDAAIKISDIEKVLKKYSVRLIIIDQGDNIRFRGDRSLAEHERLKKVYAMLRELAKKFNPDIITAGQASADAANKMYLQLTHMDSSKTGKPGALDYAIGIGALLEGNNASRRFISVCKNKLLNGGKGQFPVHFDSLIARFTDYKED